MRVALYGIALVTLIGSAAVYCQGQVANSFSNRFPGADDAEPSFDQFSAQPEKVAEEETRNWRVVRQHVGERMPSDDGRLVRETRVIERVVDRHGRPVSGPKAEQFQKIWKHTQKTNQAVTELRNAKTDHQKEAAQRKVAELLSTQYDLLLEDHERQLAKLEDRLDQLRKELTRRREAKKELVALRLKLLVHEANGLGWPDFPGGVDSEGRRRGVSTRMPRFRRRGFRASEEGAFEPFFENSAFGENPLEPGRGRNRGLRRTEDQPSDSLFEDTGDAVESTDENRFETNEVRPDVLDDFDPEGF